MEKIKFRGMTEDGKYIFSNSIQFDVDSKGRKFCRLKDEFGNWLYVAPDSVAQFVGYDADGKEIYEGDKICLKDDGNFSDVEMYFKFGGCFCPVGKKFSAFKLKERGENENLS